MKVSGHFVVSVFRVVEVALVSVREDLCLSPPLSRGADWKGHLIAHFLAFKTTLLRTGDGVLRGLCESQTQLE